MACDDVFLEISLDSGSDRGEFFSLTDELFQDGICRNNVADILSRREYQDWGRFLATYYLKLTNNWGTFALKSGILDACKHNRMMSKMKSS